MKHKRMITLALMVIFFAFCPLLFAEQINLENGAITFDAPAGFTRLTAKEIQISFPGVEPPSFVVANKGRTVTIACTFMNTGLPPEKLVDSDLPNAQKKVAQNYARTISGIKWIKNEITNINGKKWIFFEMTSTVLDFHAMVLLTIYRGQYFMVNLNSMNSEFQKVGPELNRCIQTLRVKSGS
jgi:hypothetical protein